jgi:sulfonate transport system permease protein
MDSVQAFLGPALPAMLVTAMVGYTGLILSMFAALSCTAIAVAIPRVARCLNSILLLCYLAPTFAIAQFGRIFGLDVALGPLLVFMALAYPLSVIVSQSLTDAATRSAPLLTGGPLRRLAILYLPIMSPRLLFGLGACVPWALLAAMLSEMATGNHGLGHGLFFLAPYGLSRQLPFCILAATCSLLPYLFLTFIGRSLNRYLALTEVNIAQEKTVTVIAQPVLEEPLYMALVFGVAWYALHQQAPVLAPDLMSVINRLSNGAELSPLVRDSTVYTLVATCLGMLLGSGLGYLLALLTFRTRLARSLVTLCLLPLQMIPLIVFIPLLRALQKGLEGNVLASTSGASLPQVWTEHLLVPTIIAAAATTYVSFQIGSERLLNIPKGLGPIINTRRHYDIRVLRYIFIPWVLRTFPVVFQVAVPRAFLAVMVSEYLVSGVGLGALLNHLRQQSAYGDFWSALIAMLLIVVLAYELFGYCAKSVGQGRD